MIFKICMARPRVRLSGGAKPVAFSDKTGYNGR